VRIALFPYGEPEREAYGVRLLNQVSVVLRSEFDPPDLRFAPTGPDFDYDACPALFRGRRGRGPLHVLWDTNLLIDYFEHGHSLWEVGLPDSTPDYVDELEALQFIIALWVIRDLRFHILRRVLADAKRRLSGQRLAERVNALEQFAAALRLVESGDAYIDAPSRDGLLILPRGELSRALERLPSSDRALIRDAVDLGAHVFLTRDKGVLNCRQELLPFGLLLASPGDLLEDLVSCGAFHCLWAPRYAYRPLPDQGRVTHLVDVLRHAPDAQDETE
jgi:hypothetical protein